ncbi:MAG: hypothetical protein IPF68_11500 [Bacteroidales bacterium]|nr:hypothetical protein [Bacteroidales bacterium]
MPEPNDPPVKSLQPEHIRLSRCYLQQGKVKLPAALNDFRNCPLPVAITMDVAEGAGNGGCSSHGQVVGYQIKPAVGEGKYPVHCGAAVQVYSGCIVEGQVAKNILAGDNLNPVPDILMVPVPRLEADAFRLFRFPDKITVPWLLSVPPFCMVSADALTRVVPAVTLRVVPEVMMLSATRPDESSNATAMLRMRRPVYPLNRFIFLFSSSWF